MIEIISATVGAYVVVLAATFFGLPTLLSGLVSMPFLMIQTKIKKPGKGMGLYIIPVCVNVLFWLSTGALWGLILGGPMPLLLFVAVFLVYGLTAKDKNLTREGFRLAGAEQWSVVLAAITHVSYVGFRWY